LAKWAVHHAADKNKLSHMNERYDIQLEVLTPLAIGAGTDKDWARGTDYVVKGNKVYVLDLQEAFVQGCDLNKLSYLLSKSDEKGICELFGDNISKFSRYIFDLPAESSNPIKAFLRNQLHDKPLIAGSSIKGAVRSALFNFFRTEEKNEREVIGNIKDKTDFIRFIQIGDIEMDATSLVNTKLFNLWKERDRDFWHGGWKNGFQSTFKYFKSTGFNTLYECVMPGAKGHGYIKFVTDNFLASLIDKDIFYKTKYSDKKKQFLEGGIEELFAIINDYTWEYLKKEENFFDKYRDAERSDDILDGINDLFNLVPRDNSCCVMKMSAGSGFHTMTGDWQFEDYTRTGFNPQKFKKEGEKVPNYKSRKIAEFNDGLALMGFVKISTI
jgi:hypothetical protein